MARVISSAIGVTASTNNLLTAASISVPRMLWHPRQSVWAFELPQEVPTLAVQLPEQKPVAPEAKIRTVLIQPELDQICLTGRLNLTNAYSGA